MTPALKEEGMTREIARTIQGMRKDAGYEPADSIALFVAGDGALQEHVRRNEQALKKTGNIRTLSVVSSTAGVFDCVKEIELEGMRLWLGIRKTGT
ncbi:MAG: hypothetical protein HYW98_01505 [Candidatus Wildermuthbacteria bacterium]|nr:hypothetical protein [Candidatus Wildermuthbacteria bacterium]